MAYSAFYLEQAEQAKRDAEATALPNVQLRHLRAAEAWSEMGNRARRTEEIARQRVQASALAKGF